MAGWCGWTKCGRDENGNGTGDNTTRQYFCRNGVKTELTQQRYVPGKDVRNIRILDAQQGRVLAALRHQKPARDTWTRTARPTPGR